MRKKEYPLAVPTFKAFFSKEVKDMWEMLEKPDGLKTKDLLSKVDNIQNSLNALKHDIQDYDQY